MKSNTSARSCAALRFQGMKCKHVLAQYGNTKVTSQKSLAPGIARSAARPAALANADVARRAMPMCIHPRVIGRA